MPAFRTYELNQYSPYLRGAANVGCTLHCLIVCRLWRECRHPGFVATWLSQNRQDAPALAAALCEGGQLMSSYISVVKSRQERSLGTALDCFTLPDEIQANVAVEPLASDHQWLQMRAFLSSSRWHPLSFGCTLTSALRLVVAHRMSLTGQEAGYIVVSRSKAFAILACAHDCCGFFLIDTHAASAEHSECSRAAICADADQILQFLCRGLYGENDDAHVFAASFPAVHRGSSVGSGLSTKAEHAPSKGRDMQQAFPEQVLDLVTPPSTPAKKRRMPAAATPVQTKVTMKIKAESRSMGARVPGSSETTVPECQVPDQLPLQSNLPSNDPSPDALVKHEGEDEEDRPLVPRGKIKTEALALTEAPQAVKALPVTRLQQKEARREQQRGKDICAAAGFDFHKHWFPRHDYAAKRGHWPDFPAAVAMSDVAALPCALCTELSEEFNLMNVEASAAPKQYKSKPSMAVMTQRLAELKKQEGLEDAKRGRRPKNQTETPLSHRLFDWISEKRCNIYTRAAHPTKPLMFWCSLCKQELDAVRPSSIFWILQHESYDQHWSLAHEEAPHVCEGLPVQPGGGAERIFRLQASFRCWAEHDMPWTSNKGRKHACHCKEKIPYLRCLACSQEKKLLDPGTGPQRACGGCLALANDSKFCDSVAMWAFIFDVVHLLHSVYSGLNAERQKALRSIREADYAESIQRQYGLELDKLPAMDFHLLHGLVRRTVGTVAVTHRNEAADKYLQSRFAWLPASLSNKMPKETVQRMIHRHVDYLAGGDPTPGMRVPRLMAERLDLQEVCKTLISCLANRIELLGKNKTRLTTSRVPNVQDARLADAGFFLSSLSGTHALLEAFGLNPKKIERSPMNCPNLPRFFEAETTEPEALGQRCTMYQNALDAFQLLGINKGDRNLVLTFDETVLFPAYAQFRDHRGAVYIGGADLKARVPMETTKPRELSKSDLAQTTLFYLLKRADTDKRPVAIQCRPRRLKSVTAEANVREVGRLLEIITEANGNVPPLAISMDNLGSQQIFPELYLGLRPLSSFSGVPFFQHCSLTRRLEIPQYEARSLIFSRDGQAKHVIFCCNDPAHTVKNLACSSRSKHRTLTQYGMFLSRCVQLAGGMPFGPWQGRDKQSDRESAWLLNPSCVPTETWDSMPMFEVFMLASPWLSAPMMTPEEALENSFCGYYSLLLNVMCAHTANPKKWETLTYAKPTTRHALFMACAMIERCMHHPEGCPWAPNKTTELPCEHYFGRMKSMCGSQVPTLKLSILACQRLHYQHMKAGAPVPPTQRFWAGKGLGPVQVKAIAEKAKLAACTLQAAVNVEASVESVVASLESWWRDHGMSLLLSTASTPGPVAAEDSSDSELEVLEDDPQLPDTDGAETDKLKQGLDILEKEAALQTSLEECLEAELQDDIHDKLDSPDHAAEIDEEDSQVQVMAASATASSSDAKGPRTLSQILAASYLSHLCLDSVFSLDSAREATIQGHLENYKPPDADNVALAVERAQQMQPFMAALLTEARSVEGFLSQTVLGKEDKPLNPQQEIQAELAAARRDWQLLGYRQSRTDQWSQYAKLVAQEVDTLCGEAAAGNFTVFRPSWVRGAGNQRNYQFVALREHVCGEVLIGLIEECFRVTARKKGQGLETKKMGTCKPFPGELPANLAGALHIRLLHACGNGHYITSALHKKLSIEPHSVDKGRPQLLFEIPPKSIQLKETKSCLAIRLDPLGQKSLQAASGCDVQLTGDASSEPAALVYTSECFENTKQGQRMIQSYVQEMSKMYLKVAGKQIWDDQGQVKIRNNDKLHSPDLAVCVVGGFFSIRWIEIVERAPGYFSKKFLTKTIAGKATTTLKNFSRSVWSEFAAVAPTKTRGSAPFIAWLRELHDIAPACLPTHDTV
ncbi:unnamed protein product [Symbiodinium sp. CCMP2592]|nr:unnamed protein product [Symbiodinium sp. CCMP2592]